jgi:hypothetical protein
MAECIGKRVLDDLKSAAMIVALEVLHILRHVRDGLVELDDFRQ